MVAELSSLAPAPAGADTYLQYQPPAGSTLVGGTVDVTLSAYGYGSNSSGSAAAEARLHEPARGDVFFQCVAFFQTCGPAGTDPSSGAPMFDHQQPCLASEVVDAPVPTSGLPDGPAIVSTSP